MLTLVSKDSVKISDHFDVLCVLIACMVLEIINQMSKNQKSSLIVWNTVYCFIHSVASSDAGTIVGGTVGGLAAVAIVAAVAIGGVVVLKKSKKKSM